MENISKKSCEYCALADVPGFRGYYYCREEDKPVKRQTNCCFFRPIEDIDESEGNSDDNG